MRHGDGCHHPHPDTPTRCAVPFAVRSALAQEGAEIELFVIGDGVEDDTRRALEPYIADPRVRFYDRPKGERHGERLRHEALQDSTAPIICYLGDDDLLLPGHVLRMGELLDGADLAMALPANVWPDGSIRYYAFDLGRSEFAQLLAEGRGGGGLTGVAHTRRIYDRLPFGWRPAPPGKPTDIHMWQQFLTIPGFSGVTSDRLTSLSFPSPLRKHMTVDERVAELERLGAAHPRPAVPKGARGAYLRGRPPGSRTTQADVAPPRGRARTPPAHALVADKTSVRGTQTRASAERQSARSSLSVPSTWSRGRSGQSQATPGSRRPSGTRACRRGELEHELAGAGLVSARE